MYAIGYMKLPLRSPADIGAIIRDRRKALGLDQSALAAQIGVGRLWVNQVEKGKPGASIGLVLRALATVGVELSATIGGEPNDPRPQPVNAPDINAVINAAKRRDKR
jgi:y4mF family transcriptional regulator